jgi:hypothetical protein
LRWSLKQSNSPRWDPFQQYVTRHLHPRKLSQFLTFSGWESNFQFDSRLSFGHNLCFRCPNESCKPILDIYISIAFQWYEGFLAPLGFDPCNHSLNIRESTRTPTPNMGVHLGMWRFFPSHSFALPRAWEYDSRA